MVVGALVVLRRGHGFEVLAIDKREHGHLGAGQVFLDDHARARAAEGVAVDRVLDRGDSLFLGHGDRDTLAERQTVRLDNDRCALRLDVVDRLRGILKHRIGRGGNVVFFHQLFGKGLGAFDDGCVFARAKRADARFLERIHHAERKRVVRCDHHKVGLVRLGKGNHAVDVRGLDVHALSLLCDAAVARRAPDMVHLGAFL